MSQKEINRFKKLLAKANKENEELRKMRVDDKIYNEETISKLMKENEKLTLDFQNYKFEANKKEDRLVVFNQQLGKSCEELKKKSSNQLVKRIASHKKEVEELQEEIASRKKYVKLIHKLSRNFHNERCGDNITLEYICKQIQKGQQRKTIGDPNVEEYPEYQEFMTFFYYIKDMLEKIEEIKDANGEVFKKGYDTGREEILYQKDSEIEKLEEEIEKLNEQAYYHCEEIKEIREKNIELKEEACEKEEGTQAIIIRLKGEIDTMRKTLYKIQGR